MTLLRELFERYSASLAGVAPPSFPKLAVTYRDFVELELRALGSEESRAFWLQKLDGEAEGRVPRGSVGAEVARAPAEGLHERLVEPGEAVGERLRA
jgi:hypothetical protein